MAAPARHDYAADNGHATKTEQPIALVDTVPLLKFAAFAFGIAIIGNGGAAKANRFFKDGAHRTVQCKKLFFRQAFG